MRSSRRSDPGGQRVDARPDVSSHSARSTTRLGGFESGQRTGAISVCLKPSPLKSSGAPKCRASA